MHQRRYSKNTIDTYESMVILFFNTITQKTFMKLQKMQLIYITK